MLTAQKRLKDLAYLDYAERQDEKRQLYNDLNNQIRKKNNDLEYERNKEREEELRLQNKDVFDPTKCPHGKKYICSHCEKSYPRNYLSKRPLKHY